MTGFEGRENLNPERVLAPQDAYENALSTIGKFKLEADIKVTGKSVETYVCTVANSRGQVATGVGKGLGRQSLTSAICEAIEHYFHEFDDPSLVNVSYCLDEGCPLADSCLRLERFSSGLGPLQFESAEYVSLRDPESSVWLPIFLTDVDHQPAGETEELWLHRLGLRRYSSNSGTSAGSTLEEALLHSVLELIERDSIGMELLRTIFKKPPSPARRVILDDGCASLVELRQLAISETKGKLNLYEITSDLGVPSFLAEICTREKKFFGSGASLYRSYAAERAILEAVQGFHSKAVDHFGFAYRRNWIPLLLSNYRRGYLEAGIFDYRGGVTEVPFAHSGINPNINVESQLEILVDILSKNGVPIFYRKIIESEDPSFCVAQAVAPCLERFHLIGHGIPVAPGYRGRTILEE